MIRAWAAALGGFASAGAFTRRRAPHPTRRRTPELFEGAYARGGVEPPLEDVLSDPIIQLVMRSDRLDLDHLRRAARPPLARSLER